MSSKKHERRIAREAALSLLYSSDIAETDLNQVIEEGWYPADGLALSDYAESLVLGVVERLEDIDARLGSTSENWALDRMPVVDRAILRLAVYEMVYVDEVPVSVAINEAVELAKVYGGEDDSSRFVNGILGRIARSLEAEAQAAPEPEPEAQASEPEAQAQAAPEAEAPAPEAQAAPEPEPEPETTAPEPEAQVTPEPEAQEAPEPEAQVTPEPEAQAAPEPEAQAGDAEASDGE